MSNAAGGDDAAFAAAFEAWLAERAPRDALYGAWATDGAEWARSWQVERDAATLARYRAALEAALPWAEQAMPEPGAADRASWVACISQVMAALAEPAAEGSGA